MKFLLDGGVPRSIQDYLSQAGFDVLRLVQVNLADATDEQVFSFAQKEKRVLITRDKDFGNLNDYPLGAHKGIIVIRDPNLSAKKIRQVFEKAWLELKTEDISGSLIVITQKKVRIRRPKT